MLCLPKIVYVLLVGLLSVFTPVAARPNAPVVVKSKVQTVLEQWNRKHPDLINQLPNGRLYLKHAKAESTPPALESALQVAFYQDYAPVCQLYGERYLLDWHLLLSKAARETYWGASRLCNSADNYFGLRMGSKEWVCTTFGFCEVVEHMDPDPVYFFVFPGFEASLWMFIHTIYSRHFLERLPDAGQRVTDAIYYERSTGLPYWVVDQANSGAYRPLLLPGTPYTDEEIAATWSGYPINNLCVACDIDSDLNWVEKVYAVKYRVEDKNF